MQYKDSKEAQKDVGSKIRIFLSIWGALRLKKYLLSALLYAEKLVLQS